MMQDVCDYYTNCRVIGSLNKQRPQKSRTIKRRAASYFLHRERIQQLAVQNLFLPLLCVLANNDGESPCQPKVR